MEVSKQEQENIDKIVTKLRVFLETKKFRSFDLLQAPPIYYK